MDRAKTLEMKEKSMKRRIIVVYDTVYGNTKKIAEAITDGFLDREKEADCRLLHAADVTPADVAASDLIVAGSPTRAFRATEPLVRFANDPAVGWQGKAFIAFDTRIDPAVIRFGLFRKIVTSAGYAADHIAKLLVRRGAVAAADTAGFLVTGKEGTILVKGEEERAFAQAGEWLAGLSKQ
jgi:flavodoxin